MDIMYIYIYTSSPYTMQVETIIYGKIISHGERVINVTYLKKLRHGSKWYTQTDVTEVVILLQINFHPKLEVPPRLCGYVQNIIVILCSRRFLNFYMMIS